MSDTSCQCINQRASFFRRHIHHVNIALGSLAELDTQLELAVEFEFVSRNDVVEATDLSRQLGRLMLALVRALESPRAS